MKARRRDSRKGQSRTGAVVGSTDAAGATARWEMKLVTAT
jgi:hypothetical protein